MYRKYERKGIDRTWRQNNYIKVGRNHIFLNFFPHNMAYVKDLLELDHNQRIHVFISTPYSAGESITYLIRAFAEHDTEELSHYPTYHDPHRKIIIHIPKKVRDLATLLESTFRNEKDRFLHMLFYKIVIERQGPSFVIPGTEQMLDITYDDGGINASVSLAKAKYEEYFFPDINERVKVPFDASSLVVPEEPALDGVLFDNRIQKRNPELFREQIISNYKAAIPKRHLRLFQNDEVIWNYLSYYIYCSKEKERKKFNGSN